MKLPVALQRQLKESEEKYLGLLERLGCRREDLQELARKTALARPATRQPTAASRSWQAAAQRRK